MVRRSDLSPKYQQLADEALAQSDDANVTVTKRASALEVGGMIRCVECGETFEDRADHRSENQAEKHLAAEHDGAGRYEAVID